MGHGCVPECSIYSLGCVKGVSQPKDDSGLECITYVAFVRRRLFSAVCVWMSEIAGAAGDHAFTLEHRVSRPLAARAVHEQQSPDDDNNNNIHLASFVGECVLVIARRSLWMSRGLSKDFPSVRHTLRRQTTDEIKGHYAFFFFLRQIQTANRSHLGRFHRFIPPLLARRRPHCFLSGHH